MEPAAGLAKSALRFTDSNREIFRLGNVFWLFKLQGCCMIQLVFLFVMRFNFPEEVYLLIIRMDFFLFYEVERLKNSL